MRKFKYLLSDLFFFVQILVYWPLAFILLKPLKWIDQLTKTGYFKHIDKLIKKIAGR